MKEINNIRTNFLDYFQKNKHTIVPSSPLIPRNDPTLMFVSAGMVQFKDKFTGNEISEYSRAASSQKCIRAGGKHNDLDNVGYTARHHTFFEMLGNFSFGDYFKETAIELAWNFLTKELQLPSDKLYVTIYHNDDEASKLWRKISSLSEEKIIKIASDDNFWSMGDLGPCGPCSEIFFDHGDKVAGGLPGSANADGDRFVEIWNLVFMQYEKLANNQLIKLPKPSIDTGMGLERIAAVVQNVHNNYETDLFLNLINYAQEITKVKINDQNIASYRVVIDHLRSISFLLADGILPSNEGRGYVLRRIMRRAMRHCQLIGVKEPLIYKLVISLITQMKTPYSELDRAKDFITETIKLEEEKFSSTLSRGIRLLEQELTKNSIDQFSGEVAFKLYDTYGFPLDLTKDILRKHNIQLDEPEFNEYMDRQRQLAKKSWIGSGENFIDELWFNLYNKFGSTEFIGYYNLESQAQVVCIIDQQAESESFDQLNKPFILITNQTPFYPEAGGQIGDIGIINNHSLVIEVVNTTKYFNNIIAHHCILRKGKVSKNDVLNLLVDKKARQKLKVNHTATHIIHWAIRKILGTQVTQKGSLVGFDKLRFDINYPKPIVKEQLIEIELLANKIITSNNQVKITIKSAQEAIDEGAMALFGEKYPAQVRVISFGAVDLDNSIELCGGTHVDYTGEIGLLKITSTNAVSAGIKRIEALTGIAAVEYVNSQEQIINNLTKLLKISQIDLYQRVNQLIEDKKRIEEQFNQQQINLLIEDINQNYQMINKIKFINKVIYDINPKKLRKIIELIKLKNSFNCVIALIGINEKKASLILSIANNLLPSLNAIDIVTEAGSIIGGQNAGGRLDFAQAGGTKIDLADLAITKIKQLIAI